MRGPRRHFTHSKVMAWVAFDRAVKTLEQRTDAEGDVEHFRRVRDEIHEQVCDEGYDSARNTFTQYYGSDELDAATLLIPAVGFLPPDDARVIGTIDAIQAELAPDGLVRRYSTSEGRDEVDGLHGEEGAFLPCTFWLADALAMAGRTDEAREIFERLLGLVNDVGLISEEYDPERKRLIGNFPQAFTHLALINTASLLGGVKSVSRPRGRRRGRRWATSSSRPRTPRSARSARPTRTASGRSRRAELASSARAPGRRGGRRSSAPAS